MSAQGLSSAAIVARIDAYERLVRLDKPIGILLLLWPTLWGLWIAGRGVPNLLALWLFLLGTVLMRSAGCAMTRVVSEPGCTSHARTASRWGGGSLRHRFMP